MAERWNRGEVKDGIPADSWNQFVDTAQKVASLPTPSGRAVGQAGQSHGLTIQVTPNDSAKTADFPIVVIGTPTTPVATTPTENANIVRDAPVFECATPGADPTTNFVVIQGPCEENRFATAIIEGDTWVQIDVTNAAHNYAVADASDATKLYSTANPGVRIRWKESGTGTKWAIVTLGRVRSHLRWGVVQSGGVSAATSADIADWGQGNVAFYDDEGVAAGTVEVTNPFPALFAEGYTVCCDDSKSPPWVVSGSCEGFA